jgi:hypothetical protein
MTSHQYIDLAIEAADDQGVFDPAIIARQVKVNKQTLTRIGADLMSRNLVSTGRSRWRLLGVARDMARAVRRR